jgi:hypothetical protein
MDFLKTHKEGLETLGFWTNESKSSTLKILESRYKTEIIRDWTIVDFTINGNDVLINWKKRFVPLSKKELKDEYGR